MPRRLAIALLCAWLLLVFSGCGNKGPLLLPEEAQQKKDRQKSSEY